MAYRQSSGVKKIASEIRREAARQLSGFPREFKKQVGGFGDEFVRQIFGGPKRSSQTKRR